MRERAGFALVAALVGIVLIAVLVTASLFASIQETHASAAEVLDQQAAAYAERAALATIAFWSCPECDAMRVGGVIIRSPAAQQPFESTVFITRLDSALFLVTAEGRVNASGAARLRRRVSIAVIASRDARGVPQTSRVSEQAWSAAYQM